MIQKSNLKIYILLLIILALSSVVAAEECPSGKQCTSCPDNCDKCDNNATICDQCALKYYVDPTTLLCSQCPTKCLNCSTPYECIECTPGYDTAYDENGYQYCIFYWWKWFLIIFGTILGLALLFLIIYFIRKKLKEEDTKNKEIEYEMKLQTTQPNIT